MAEISMTTFVDFVLASGTKRLTCVRQAKSGYEQGYEVARDFYRPLREAIKEMHQAGAPKETLTNLLNDITDIKKLNVYPECISSYQRWCGRKQFQWIGTYPIDWADGGLIVHVNPEIGMKINGKMHVIKLYFKLDAPSKLRLETMFHLLQINPIPGLAGAIPAILDVRRGKLYTKTRDVPEIEALLSGEAAAFRRMWDQL